MPVIADVRFRSIEQKQEQGADGMSSAVRMPKPPAGVFNATRICARCMPERLVLTTDFAGFCRGGDVAGPGAVHPFLKGDEPYLDHGSDP